MQKRGGGDFEFEDLVSGRNDLAYVVWWEGWRRKVERGGSKGAIVGISHLTTN